MWGALRRNLLRAQVKRAVKVAAAARKRSKAAKKAAIEEAKAGGAQRQPRPAPKGASQTSVKLRYCRPLRVRPR